MKSGKIFEGEIEKWEFSHFKVGKSEHCPHAQTINFRALKNTPNLKRSKKPLYNNPLN